VRWRPFSSHSPSRLRAGPAEDDDHRAADLQNSGDVQSVPILEAPVSAEIAELAARLPSAFHGDPADRIITATAAKLGCPLATRDKRLLRYGQSTRFIGIVAA